MSERELKESKQSWSNDFLPVMAVDYGEKHIGLAISDRRGIVAAPLTVLHVTRNRDINVLIEELIEISNSYRVNSLLIGLPQNFSENPNTAGNRVLEFTKTLSLRYQKPIFFHDESFSTRTAYDTMSDMGSNIRKTKKKVDKIAAAIFLQEFLNSKKQ